MYFLDKRVNVICEELKRLKVKQKFTIARWDYMEGNFFHPADAEADGAGHSYESSGCVLMSICQGRRGNDSGTAGIQRNVIFGV